MKTQGAASDPEVADAILLLEAPRREAPDWCITSRATFSYGLILVFSAALIVAAFALLVRAAPAWLVLPLPRW
jgi:hypothetical protein